LDAQPEQVANVVSRIFCSLGVIFCVPTVIINYKPFLAPFAGKNGICLMLDSRKIIH